MEQVKSDLHQMEIQVQEVQEHERLLVEYPDLNGPVNPDLSGINIATISNRAEHLPVNILYLLNNYLINTPTI